LEAVQQVLAACGWQINTAFIERVNLTIRQYVAAVGRRVMTLCKGAEGLRQQLALYHVYYNFCLPHASLRVPLLQSEPTHGTGSAKRWQPRTPAMAAGLTDPVWTLRVGTMRGGGPPGGWGPCSWACLQAAQGGVRVRPENGLGAPERLRGDVAGVGGGRPGMTRAEGHLHCHMMHSHRSPNSTSS